MPIVGEIRRYQNTLDIDMWNGNQWVRIESMGGFNGEPSLYPGVGLLGQGQVNQSITTTGWFGLPQQSQQYTYTTRGIGGIIGNLQNQIPPIPTPIAPALKPVQKLEVAKTHKRKITLEE